MSAGRRYADDRSRIALEQGAMELFQRLSVYREDVPNVINVTFSSKDPNKAAKIANAICQCVCRQHNRE